MPIDRKSLKSLKVGDKINLTITMPGAEPAKRTATVVDVDCAHAPVVYLNDRYDYAGTASYATAYETKRVETIKKLGLDPTKLNLWHASNGDTSYDSFVASDPRIKSSIDPISLKAGERIKLTITIAGKATQITGTMLGISWNNKYPMVYLDTPYKSEGFASFRAWNTNELDAIKKLGLDSNKTNLFYDSGGQITWDEIIPTEFKSEVKPLVEFEVIPLAKPIETSIGEGKVGEVFTVGNDTYTVLVPKPTASSWDKGNHCLTHNSVVCWAPAASPHMTVPSDNELITSLGFDLNDNHFYYAGRDMQGKITGIRVKKDISIDAKTLKPGDKIKFVRGGKLYDGIVLTPDYCGISWVAEDRDEAGYNSCTDKGKWQDQNATKWADAVGLFDQTKIGFTNLDGYRIVSVEPKSKRPELSFTAVRSGDRITYWIGSDKETIHTAVVLSNKPHAKYPGGNAQLAEEREAGKKWVIDGQTSNPANEWAKHCGLDTAKFSFRTHDEKTLHITSLAPASSVLDKSKIELGDYVRLRYRDGSVRDCILIATTSDSSAFAELGKAGDPINASSELGKNAAVLGVSATDYTYFWQNKTSDGEVIGHTPYQCLDIKKLNQGDKFKGIHNGVIIDGIVIDPNGYSVGGRYYAEAKATATYEKNATPSQWDNNTANNWAKDVGIDRANMGYSYSASSLVKVLWVEPKPIPIDQDKLEVGDNIEIEIDRNGTKIIRIATVVSTAKDERAHFKNDSEAGIILHSEAPDEESGSFLPLNHWKANADKMLLPTGYNLGWRLYKTGRNTTKVIRKIGSKRPTEGNIQPDAHGHKCVAGDRIECIVSQSLNVKTGDHTIATGTVIGEYGSRSVVFDSPIFVDAKPWGLQTEAKMQTEASKFDIKALPTTTTSFGNVDRLRLLPEKLTPIPEPEVKAPDLKEAIALVSKTLEGITASGACIINSAAVKQLLDFTIEKQAKEADFKLRTAELFKRETNLAVFEADMKAKFQKAGADLEKQKEVKVESAQVSEPATAGEFEFVSAISDNSSKLPSGTRVQVQLGKHLHKGTILYTETNTVRMFALDEDCADCCDPKAPWEDGLKRDIQEEGLKFGVVVNDANTHNLGIFSLARLLPKEEQVPEPTKEADPSKGVQAMMVAGTAFGALISAILRTPTTPSVRVEMPESILETMIDEVASETLTQT
jgi:hypothetical protein